MQSAQYPQFKTFIVQINGQKFGDVVIGKYAEFIIFREQKNFYRNCPCKKCEKGRCIGFTVRTDVIADAVRLGANVLKINFKRRKNDKKLETYIIGMDKFMKSFTGPDNKGMLQYECPLHEFIQVE